MQNNESDLGNSMEGWRSVILGATGLTGSNLMRILSAKSKYKTVDVLVRRNINVPTKVTQHITAFRE
jgi:N-acetyl-gamma-glutamylphosphate reductase